MAIRIAELRISCLIFGFSLCFKWTRWVLVALKLRRFRLHRTVIAEHMLKIQKHIYIYNYVRVTCDLLAFSICTIYWSACGYEYGNINGVDVIWTRKSTFKFKTPVNLVMGCAVINQLHPTPQPPRWDSVDSLIAIIRLLIGRIYTHGLNREKRSGVNNWLSLKWGMCSPAYYVQIYENLMDWCVFGVSNIWMLKDVLCKF